MQEKAKIYFTSGEFAKLCGTTKETLRHYDAMDLLKPKHRGENQYGYYTADQFFDYDLINTLKEANCSLREIKEYLSNHNTENFIEFLREKERQLEQEKEKIDRMQRFLQRTVEVTENALHAVYDVPQLRHCEEEYLIAMEVPNGRNTTLVDFIGHMRDHYDYVKRRQLGEEYQMGSIVLQETLEKGLHFDSYYSTKIYERVENERLHVKPEGDYVVLLHKGSFEEWDRVYGMMFDYIKENGLTICGNAYEYDMVDGLAAAKMEDFITRISIQVAHAPSGGSPAPQPAPGAGNRSSEH